MAETDEVLKKPETDRSKNGFADLGLRKELLNNLVTLGYSDPTPVQAEAIPYLLAGSDLLGQAATGTGKTAAFALPILNGIDSEEPVKLVALILVPTRELAMQVTKAIAEYGAKQDVKVVAVYGGQPIQQQLSVLRKGVHVVVATPGRAIDHLKRKSLKLDALKTVVLDEADEMLDMGFTEDIETILETTPADRQTVLFSATLPPRINSIAKRYQIDPVRVQIVATGNKASKNLVRQSAYLVQRKHKPAALGRILDIEAPKATIVFCKTRTDVDELTATMNTRGYRAEALHGGMDQNQRDRVMGRLREGTAELLVATDVAARGLDVDSLTHVVNFDVPAAPESYVHRIGRVGRAGREGVAITLAEPKNRRALANIEHLTKQTIQIQKVPSVDDLRRRQTELTVLSVTEALASPDLEDYNPVLHALAGAGSDRSIALAALKLLHLANNADIQEIEIPEISDKGNSERRGGSRGGKAKGREQGKERGRKGQKYDGAVGSVYIELGKRSGIRPGDLVGAIAGETNLTGSQIGPIRISDNFAIVGVPEKSVDSVVKAIKATTIKGKKAKARRYVE
ncbi:MAG: ATP-dependent RNA helicase DeaD [Candidatus Poriferisodalaceae bacterium]|jgi:ATP-dependent RNA helicase DeaD|tara:strand:+ start:110 stop:1822 length:1713 start_codon:yes stop_codon:yes gene_type:complete